MATTKKPQGTIEKAKAKFRELVDSLTGGAKTASETAIKTSKNAISSANEVAGKAGTAIKDNPKTSAAVAGAIVAATAVAAVAISKTRKPGSNKKSAPKSAPKKPRATAKAAVKRTPAKKPAPKKPTAEKPVTETKTSGS